MKVLAKTNFLQIYKPKNVLNQVGLITILRAYINHLDWQVDL